VLTSRRTDDRAETKSWANLAGSYETEPLDAAPGRLQTFELLAAELGER
jgi:hypothetical protein